MVRWVRDRSGRFPERPHYTMDEIDQECEQMMKVFLRRHRGQATCPIRTDDLMTLIEQEAADLDTYADLDDDVEGVTHFFRDGKPKVEISRLLTENERRENRLRTTLTHELWHVKYHNFIFFFDQGPLVTVPTGGPVFSPACKRDGMIDAPESDWLEWQAGYASGAFLMPLTALQRVVEAFLDQHELTDPLSIDDVRGRELIRYAQARFRVSADAARVRLLKRGYLLDTP